MIYNILDGKECIRQPKKVSKDKFEYIRKKKGSLRSVHPVFSVSAIGKNQKKIYV